MNEICTRLVEILKERNLTIATAESCTGGLIAKTITDVSGASSVFWGGVVSYDNSVKENVLGVKHSTLEAFGAVSYETAREMAQGVKTLCKTDIGISTTGIAGPTGGTPEKPVGTVFLGFAIGDTVESVLLSLPSDSTRDEIRCSTVDAILKAAIDKICQNY